MDKKDILKKGIISEATSKIHVSKRKEEVCREYQNVLFLSKQVKDI